MKIMKLTNKNMKKTHWKKLDNPKYLGAYSLIDGETKEVTATIEKVVVEGVKSERGDEDCKVCYLKGMKPMILNSTNSKTIESVYGTPLIEDWIGKQIIIYVAQVKMKGKEVDGLRIRPYKPEKLEKKELVPNSEAWNSAIAKKITLTRVKEFYTIKKENEKLYKFN